jgi:glycosyltransferase involved in cell wall biosynthesis
MKVLHAPANVAGQASIISRAERSQGIKSDVLIFNQDYLEYECDYNLHLNKYPLIVRLMIIFGTFIFCLFKYDIFHFHYGLSLLPFNLDLKMYRFFNKKTLMHYWGSDIIQTDLSKKYTLLNEKIFDEIYPNINNDEKREKIKKTNSLVDVSIVGDYSLLPFSPGSRVIRQAIDLLSLPYVGCVPKNDLITIIHAPTRRGLKGTDYIISVIDQLKTEGFPIEFILVEKKPHREALEIFKKADIIVDDILQGPYGILTIECMALGKPVLDHIHESLVHHYPGLPVINTTPDTLYSNLKELIKNPNLRIVIGERGREYVETHHDSNLIARQLIETYHSLIFKNK